MADNRELTHDERMDIVEQDMAALRKSFGDLGGAVNTVLNDISEHLSRQEQRIAQLANNATKGSLDAQAAKNVADSASLNVQRLADALQKVTSLVQQLTIAVAKPEPPPT